MVRQDSLKAGLMMELPDNQLIPGSHIHLVGIGGFGLSAIARVLLGQGYTVSGSDVHRNEITDDLEDSGASIFEDHNANNVQGADLVLISSAIPATNPEIAAAIDLGIPVIKRHDFIHPLMAEKRGIAIAGTHGKTTTTGMISQILIQANYDPSIIIGGFLPVIGSNGRSGSGDYFVIEADEYDHMFLGLRPEISVITNIDFDHPDIFPTLADYHSAFSNYVALHEENSTLIVGADDGLTHDIVEKAAGDRVEIITYGLESGQWQAVDLRPNQIGGTDFLAQRDDKVVGLARLRVPGRHNVQNALAALIVANAAGVDFSVIREALAQFGGVDRRFQVIGEIGTVSIIDDYAHHPNEISATLAAAKQRYAGRRIWAVWQPHTYSRISHLRQEFTSAFDDADLVVVLPVFKSRETDDMGLRDHDISRTLNHSRASFAPSFEAATEYILERILPDDVLLTMTAGDGNQVGKMVLEALRTQLNNGQNGTYSHWIKD